MSRDLTRREVLRPGHRGRRARRLRAAVEFPDRAGAGQPAALRQPPGHPARGDPDPGEPLVRPLLRFLRASPASPIPHVLPLNDGSGLSIFAQPGYPGGFNGNHLYPFHLDSFNNGECTNDINHSWGPQHTYWDAGKMDGFVTGHIAADGAPTAR